MGTDDGSCGLKKTPASTRGLHTMHGDIVYRIRSGPRYGYGGTRGGFIQRFNARCRPVKVVPGVAGSVDSPRATAWLRYSWGKMTGVAIVGDKLNVAVESRAREVCLFVEKRFAVAGWGII